MLRILQPFSCEIGDNEVTLILLDSKEITSFAYDFKLSLAVSCKILSKTISEVINEIVLEKYFENAQ